MFDVGPIEEQIGYAREQVKKYNSFLSKAPLYEIIQSKLNPLNKIEDILQNIK